MVRNVAVATGFGAVLILGSLGAHPSAAATVVPTVVAQVPPQPSAQPGTPARAKPQPTPGLGDQKQIEGRIKSVGPSAQSIMFEDGTTLVVPESLAIRRGELTPGAVIRVQYEERDGQKVTTTIAVDPAAPLK